MEVVPAAIGQSANANQPFRFFTSFILEEATGLRAATLPQLLALLRKVPEGCIYYHTHYFLLSHHYLTPEPTNDFAYWVREILGEGPLGEQLAALDIMEYASLESLRGALVDLIDGYLARRPAAQMRFASEGEEFFFVKSVHVILPTRHHASTLAEFLDAIARVSLHALYYHIFDARLRLGHPSNDFSIWLSGQLGLGELAEHVSRLDPYAHTLEALRSLLMALVQQELDRRVSPHAHGL